MESQDDDLEKSFSGCPSKRSNSGHNLPLKLEEWRGLDQYLNHSCVLSVVQHFVRGGKKRTVATAGTSKKAKEGEGRGNKNKSKKK